MGRAKLVKMKNNQGIVVSDKKDVVEIIENFYRTLYTASPVYKEHLPTKNILNVGSEDISEITITKIGAALKQIKSPGKDRVTSKMLKLVGKMVEQATQILLKKFQYQESSRSTLDAEYTRQDSLENIRRGLCPGVDKYRPIKKSYGRNME